MSASQESTPLDSQSQSIKEQHHSICQVCALTEDDTKILLHNLLHSLASINADKVGQNVPDNGGFVKQIRMIFYSKYKFSSKCTHMRVRELFQNALGINSVQLDLLCNKKMLEMAKYSYQIDVVSQQIKTFNRHFISVSKKKKQKKNKVKQAMVEQTIQTAKSNKTKIPEECIKPEIEIEHKVKQQYFQQEVGQTNLQMMINQGDEKKQARTQYEQYQAPSILPNHLQMNIPTQMFTYPVAYPYVQMHGGWYVDINANRQP